MATFGENLKRIRKSRRMTQAELGKLIGKSHATVGRYEKCKGLSTIARYESGDIVPSVNTATAIASALDCTVGELFGEEPSTRGADVVEIIVKINGCEVMRWKNTDTE